MTDPPAVVTRYSHRTVYVRQTYLERGTTFEEATGLDPRGYAAHGCGYPMVVTALRAQLAR